MQVSKKFRKKRLKRKSIKKVDWSSLFIKKFRKKLLKNQLIKRADWLKSLLGPYFRLFLLYNSLLHGLYTYRYKLPSRLVVDRKLALIKNYFILCVSPVRLRRFKVKKLLRSIFFEFKNIYRYIFFLRKFRLFFLFNYKVRLKYGIYTKYRNFKRDVVIGDKYRKGSLNLVRCSKKIWIPYKFLKIIYSTEIVRCKHIKDFYIILQRIFKVKIVKMVKKLYKRRYIYIKLKKYLKFIRVLSRKLRKFSHRIRRHI